MGSRWDKAKSTGAGDKLDLLRFGGSSPLCIAECSVTLGKLLTFSALGFSLQLKSGLTGMVAVAPYRQFLYSTLH